MIFKLFDRSNKAESKDDWPFQGPRNEAVVTVEEVIAGAAPILLVVHDANDGGWQFLTGGPVEADRVKLVSLGSVNKLDPTVHALADLPEGWQAERQSVASEWKRSQIA